MTSVETVERMSAIIRMQSDIIASLFLELMKYISAEEAERLPAVKMVNEAAALKKDLNKGGIL